MNKLKICAITVFMAFVFMLLTWTGLTMVTSTAEELADALARVLGTDGACVNPVAAKVVAWISFLCIVVVQCFFWCRLAVGDYEDEEDEAPPKPKKIKRAKCKVCVHCNGSYGSWIYCSKCGEGHVRDRCEYMTPRMEDETDE